MVSRLMKILYVALLTIVLLNSCDNELRVNADYQATIVVFGLLDANAPKQFIKINKAFLTDGEAVQEAAQIQDSLYFSSINAELVEESTGKVIPLKPENVEGKEPGLFLNEPNILYTTSEQIDVNSEYTIRVEDLESGISVDSRTEIVSEARPNAPISFVSRDFTVQNTRNSFITINLKPGRNAFLYDVIMEFEYEEFSMSDTTVKDTQRIIWKMLNNKPVVNASGFLIQRIEPDVFFDLLTAQIPVRADWIRRPVHFRFSFVGGGDELNNYISVSRPSIGIVQKQSEYSNIRNGFGLFSSRNYLQFDWLPPSPVTRFTLSNEPKTAALGF